VQAFKSLDLHVLAAGDSYNDLPMLEEADAGFFFRAPQNIRAEHPRFPHTDEYPVLQQLLDAA
jgi:phosphoserine/homoserine phosphotransferase